MDNIVAAEFRDFASAEAAMDALEGEGIAPSQITSFYLNAPGQHGTFPIGGDQYEDPEAKGAGVGAAGGAMLGGAQPEPLSRPAGVVVAVHAPTTFDRDRATAVLQRYQANSIEHAEGAWKDGTWSDFDPVSLPKWQKPPERAH